MFVLKMVLTHFMLPPGVFIVFLMFIGAFCFSKKSRKMGGIICLVGCLMWSLSISPFSDALISNLESGFSIPEKPNGDVIILLGKGVYEKAPDLSGVGAPSDAYFGRIVTAVRLQKRLNIPIILTGQRSLIVKRFLVDLGVLADDIILENKSRNTFENAKFSKEICANLGYQKPILVTSAYHMKRSILSFKKVGLEAIPFPSGFKSWQEKQYRWTAFLPGDFAKASIALKEYVGLIFYRFAYP